MDLLSDILNLMKLSGTLYFRTSFTSPWGVEVPAFQNVSRFHYVQRGRCFADVEGSSEPVLLERGDLIIIPHGAGHILSDPLDVESKTVDQVVEESGFTGNGALVFGEPSSGHETQLICGHFAFDPDASHVLIDALPRYIHIKDYGRVSPDWLDNTLKIIGAEVGGEQLGSDLVALKLSEIIFTQAVRHYLQREGRDRPGLAGFADDHIRQGATGDSSRAREAVDGGGSCEDCRAISDGVLQQVHRTDHLHTPDLRHGVAHATGQAIAGRVGLSRSSRSRRGADINPKPPSVVSSSDTSMFRRRDIAPSRSMSKRQHSREWSWLEAKRPSPALSSLGRGGCGQPGTAGRSCCRRLSSDWFPSLFRPRNR